MLINFIIMFGNSMLPMVGVALPHHAQVNDDQLDHGDMTVLRPRNERGANVTSFEVASIKGEAFPARLECLDAKAADEINDVFRKEFGDF